MSFRDDLRQYFHRLAIRRVLERTLGSRHGEDNAPPFAFDPVIVPAHHPRPAAFLADEIRRRYEIRQAVGDLCVRISASPDRKAR